MLPEWEQELFKQFHIAYQTGKGNHLVPVLIPNVCLKGLEILANVHTRKEAGVVQNNMYMFPNTEQSPNHVSGWACIYKMCMLAGVSKPELLTATKQRHRISTIYSSLDVPENEREYFFKHMGHSREVNMGTYQYPLAVMEITKVGKHLQAIDSG